MFALLSYSSASYLGVGGVKGWTGREGVVANLHLSSFLQRWGGEKGSLTKVLSTNQASVFEQIISISSIFSRRETGGFGGWLTPL